MSLDIVGKLPADLAPRVNVVAQIVVTMTKDGKVSCSGPLDQAMMCYGLLEEAKYQINELRTKKENLFRGAL